MTTENHFCRWNHTHFKTFKSLSRHHSQEFMLFLANSLLILLQWFWQSGFDQHYFTTQRLPHPLLDLHCLNSKNSNVGHYICWSQRPGTTLVLHHAKVCFRGFWWGKVLHLKRALCSIGALWLCITLHFSLAWVYDQATPASHIESFSYDLKLYCNVLYPHQ